MAPSAWVLALLASPALGAGPISQNCPSGSVHYWANDTPNNECAETCISTKIQKAELWVLCGGKAQPAGNVSAPCAAHGFHKFDRTDVLGVGPLKLSLDKYLPDKKVQSPPSPAKNKCALKCSVGSIGVYWACAAVCIEKQAPDSCITAGCLAAVSAFDVKCLTGCNKTSSTIEGQPIMV